MILYISTIMIPNSQNIYIQKPTNLTLNSQNISKEEKLLFLLHTVFLASTLLISRIYTINRRK